MSKNEALSPEQRDLFRETLEVDSAAIAAKTEQHVPVLRAPLERAGQQPLPEQLPRIEHRHEPASYTCGECSGALVKIGEDISEQLDVTPATFFVRRHIRPQYVCRPCERIVAAPIPPAVIDGGMPAKGLIAWVLISAVKLKQGRSVAAVPTPTDRRAVRRNACALDPGGLVRSLRRRTATAGGSIERTAKTAMFAARR